MEVKEKKLPFAALTVRNYRYFLTAQIISLTGTWMHQAAQGWLVYDLTHSSLYLGYTGAVFTLPILLFTLFGGVLADRFPKKSILMFTQFLSILPPLLLGIFTLTHSITVWEVLIIAFIMGSINSIDIPSRQSFLIEMVGRGYLLNAIALHSASFHGARMLGPVIAGLLISSIGLPYCFLINALSFIPVVMVLARMQINERKTIPKDIISDFKEGFSFILHNQSIRQLLLMIMVFSIFGMPYNHFMPYFAEDIFQKGAKGLGLLMGGGGTGALLAALTLAIRGDIKNKKGYIMIASFIFPIALISFALTKNFLVAILLLMVAGFSMVSLLATANSYIQLKVPDELRGRVMSVFSFIFLGMVPIGSFSLGYLAEFVGTPVMFIFSGSLCLFAATVNFLKRHD
ncbi:MAG: MFS transporter [Nitrospirae bacterium]|nr:MAG: MFS transporter [Nitrospirota bacterium]